MSDTLSRLIGQRIVNERQRLGLTQQALAREAQVAAGTLSELEAGIINPTVATLAKLADALGVTPAQLLEEL
jgi:transcriptional regulator with XRE-family HTH domain